MNLGVSVARMACCLEHHAKPFQYISAVGGVHESAMRRHKCSLRPCARCNCLPLVMAGSRDTVAAGLHTIMHGARRSGLRMRRISRACCCCHGCRGRTLAQNTELAPNAAAQLREGILTSRICAEPDHYCMQT